MKKVLELSLWGSYNFKTYPILFILHSYFEHNINKGVCGIQFHIKKFVHMGWANQKGQPKTKIKLCTFLKCLPSELTCLPSLIGI
jgi:hypothetical protein